MRIGIVGADELGSTLAELWVEAGHQVAVGSPSGVPASTELEDRLGPSVSLTTVEEASRFGDVVVLAGAFGRPEDLPPAHVLAGRIVVDAMNALTEQGEEIDLGGRSSTTLVAERFPNARLVKAFNAIEPHALRSEARRSTPREQRFVILLAGDDVRANTVVSMLVEELGFTPITTGTLARGGRFQEPGSKLFHRHLLPAEARRALRMMG